MISNGKLSALLELLQKHGVTYIKTVDIELRVSLAQEDRPSDDRGQLDHRNDIREVSRSQSRGSDPVADAPKADPDPIQHKIEELTSIMKLSDHDLVDRLFPDTAEPEGDDIP
jgi:hypothetical protein